MLQPWEERLSGRVLLELPAGKRTHSLSSLPLQALASATTGFKALRRLRPENVATFASYDKSADLRVTGGCDRLFSGGGS